MSQNSEIDASDAAVAWNFGTRELTPDEYAEGADYNRRDLDRVYADREADAEYAAWKAANPQAAAEAEAEFYADSRARFPLLYGEPEPLPDPDPEVGGWRGWSDRAMLAPDPNPAPEPEPDAEAEIG